MPLPLYLAWKHVRRRVLQTSLTIAGVAVGVMVLIVALSLTNGFIDELLDSTLQATPHVTLRAPAAGELLAADPERLRALEDDPRVEAVAPYLGTQALIARRADASLGIGGRQGYTQILGIDPEREARVLELPALQRSGAALADDDGLVLGGSLARQLGVLTGDEVLVQNIDGRRHTFTVADTFRVGNELIDGVTSYASLAALRDYLGAEGEITGYHVRLQDPDAADEAAVALADRFGLRGTSWTSLFGNLVSQLNLQRTVIGVVVFLIVLVAAMGIANVLVLTVAEKTQEIAVLRALGASGRQVVGTFVVEGALLGGAGTVLGVALGVLVSLYFRVQPYPLPGDLYFITELPVRIRAWDLAWVAAVSFGTSLLAGLLPARRASRLDPVEVLR